MNRLRTTAVGALGVALLAACGGGAGASSSSTPQANTSATLTVAWAEQLATLNPATTGMRDVGPIDTNIFDTLVWLDKNDKATPDLATKWTVSPDGLKYDFDLRSGVKFHDGTPFDAKAVVANIDYITNANTASATSLTLLGPCTKAVELAQYKVELQCTKPYGPLLVQLGEPYLGIQSPTAITKYGKDLGSHPTGTGPFMFESYVPNQKLVLARNPDYQWAPPAVGQNGPAKIAKLVFDIVTDAQARVSEYQSGQAQFMQETPGDFFNKLGSDPANQAVAFPISGMGVFLPIDASAFPTNDVAVRQALLYSVDKTKVIKATDDGAYTVLNTPLAGSLVGYDKSIGDMYSYNPAKAASLLTGAGWAKSNGTWMKGGKKLTIRLTAPSDVSGYPVMVQAIQAQLKDAGMDAVVDLQSTNAWLDDASKTGSTVTMTPSQYVAVDPDALSVWFLPNQYLNWSHYVNPELTALLMQGRAQQSVADRTATYKKAQQLLMQQAVMLPLHENSDLVVMSSKLKGVSYAGGGFEYFYPASLEG
ncbi:MAG: peptide/nickel transport system substrate-binding protein [Frankiales bacterium]|jgi:peptide/nickel transport system substrate-binding protein|nr:peptide/nickel transport system substrate-binding protein [Frankiales bacterium]